MFRLAQHSYQKAAQHRIRPKTIIMGLVPVKLDGGRTVRRVANVHYLSMPLHTMA